MNATDPETGDRARFAIVGGTGNSQFKIDSRSGLITVANGAKLDFEKIRSYSLIVSASDAGGLSSQATVTVFVANLNEAPLIQAQGFTVPENAIQIGQVSAREQDNFQMPIYGLLDALDGPRFLLSDTGLLSVKSDRPLDYETGRTYRVIVQAIDSINSALKSSATVTINVTNVNEAPVDIAFQKSINTTRSSIAAQTLLGKFSASDADTKLAGFDETFRYEFVMPGGSSGNITNDNSKFTLTSSGDLIAATELVRRRAYTLQVAVIDRGGLRYGKTLTLAF